MKVLYILNPTHRLSGSFKSFLVMLRGLMERGVEPVLVVPKDKEQDYEQELREMGLPVLTLLYKFHAWPHSRTWKQRLLFVPRLLARFYVNRRTERVIMRQLRSTGIDMVHTNVGVIDLGRRVARRLGVPHIQHVREYGDIDFGIRHFPTKRVFVRRLQYSIFITRDLQRYFGLEGDSRSRVIYNGVHPRMDELPVRKKGVYFLFVGPVSRAKGIDQLISAFCRYSAKVSGAHALPLYVAGEVLDKSLYRQLEQKLSAIGLRERVVFMGLRSDVETLMRGARALVVPSPSEGFGRCMPEAMFNGTPVIGRNTGGTREQMDNGVRLTGREIALRYTTTEELVQCLVQAAQGFGAEEEMRKSAFEVVNMLYSDEAYVDKVFRFYEDITRENQERRTR